MLMSCAVAALLAPAFLVPAPAPALPVHGRSRSLCMAEETEMEYRKRMLEEKDDSASSIFGNIKTKAGGWSIFVDKDKPAEDPPWLKRAKASPARAQRQAAKAKGGMDALFAAKPDAAPPPPSEPAGEEDEPA